MNMQDIEKQGEYMTCDALPAYSLVFIINNITQIMQAFSFSKL